MASCGRCKRFVNSIVLHTRQGKINYNTLLLKVKYLNCPLVAFALLMAFPRARHHEIFSKIINNLNIDAKIAHNLEFKRLILSKQASERVSELMDTNEYSYILHQSTRDQKEYNHRIEPLKSEFGNTICISELMLDPCRYVVIPVDLLEKTCNYFNIETQINLNLEHGYARCFYDGFVGDWKTLAHANIIIIDKQEKTIERFEPHGGVDVLIDDIDNKLKCVLNHLVEDFSSYTYISPKDYYTDGPQTIECKSVMAAEMINKNIGNCGWWCLLYFCFAAKVTKLTLKLVNMHPDELFCLMVSFKDQIYKEEYKSIEALI